MLTAGGSIWWLWFPALCRCDSDPPVLPMYSLAPTPITKRLLRSGVSLLPSHKAHPAGILSSAPLHITMTPPGRSRAVAGGASSRKEIVTKIAKKDFMCLTRCWIVICCQHSIDESAVGSMFQYRARRLHKGYIKKLQALACRESGISFS